MTDPATTLPEYYSRRAPEYEQMWYRDDPARQQEQAAIVAAMQALFAGRRVLEVACGTAYWTQFLVATAEHVCGIDLSAEMLALARAKNLPPAKVTLRAGDAYALAAVPGNFDAGLANFWLSHVPKSRRDEFLTGLHRRLGRDAVVFMADNVYVPGVGGELVARAGCEDTFKRRELADGSKHEVLKNYYDAGQLRRIFATRAANLETHVGKCFWRVSYRVQETQ
ncbi:MAG: class I SAM-dependent methyltransferase [Limisphaerales bacterium]